MMRLDRNLFFAGCAAVLCASTAAVIADPPTSAPAIIPASSKLDIDPTEKINIIGWWTNGKEVLLINENGAFNWWDQPNRFRHAAKIGRWDRQNYRTFWLEPYVDRKNPGAMPARIRAPLRRTDGKVMVDVGSALGLLHVDVAPAAPEDLYVGRWSGPGGSLELTPDGRYELQSSPSTLTDAPLLSRASHKGTWTFDGKYIRLLSDGTAQNPVICTVVDRADSAGSTSTRPTFEALTTPIGELRRVEHIKPVEPTKPVAPVIPPAAVPVP